MHPRALRELASVGPKLFSIAFEKSWQAGKVSSEWRKGSVTPSQNIQKVFYCTIYGVLLLVVIVQHRFRNLNKVCKTGSSLGMF